MTQAPLFAVLFIWSSRPVHKSCVALRRVTSLASILLPCSIERSLLTVREARMVRAVLFSASNVTGGPNCFKLQFSNSCCERLTASYGHMLSHVKHIFQ